MYILCSYYRKYIDNQSKIEIPKTVKFIIDKYWKENDITNHFIMDNIEITEDEKDIISDIDVYKRFKTWFEERFKREKLVDQLIFNKKLEGKLNRNFKTGSYTHIKFIEMRTKSLMNDDENLLFKSDIVNKVNKDVLINKI